MNINYTEIFLTLVVLYIFIYALLKEREMLGCQNSLNAILLNKPICNNEKSPLISKINGESDASTNIVYWRRAYILSVLIIIIYTALYCNKLVMNWKVFVGILISTFFIYFSLNFYDYHLNRYIYAKISATKRK